MKSFYVIAIEVQLFDLQSKCFEILNEVDQITNTNKTNNKSSLQLTFNLQTVKKSRHEIYIENLI